MNTHLIKILRKIKFQKLKMSLMKNFFKQIKIKLVSFLYLKKINKKKISYLINLKFQLKLIYLNLVINSHNHKNKWKIL